LALHAAALAWPAGDASSRASDGQLTGPAFAELGTETLPLGDGPAPGGGSEEPQISAAKAAAAEQPLAPAQPMTALAPAHRARAEYPLPVRSIAQITNCPRVATFFTNRLDVAPRRFNEGFPG
jgi:hypothetical protein